jgi:hypothetical protein
MSAEEKINYILENVPKAKKNSKLLILVYWQLFDNIDIPETVIKDILEHGTVPETITRSLRKTVSTSNAYVRTQIEEFTEELKEE